MAQFGRASACHVEGCGFKSRLTLHSDTYSNLYFLVYHGFKSHFASQNNFANRLVGKATKIVSSLCKKEIKMRSLSEILEDLTTLFDSLSPILTDNQLDFIEKLEQELYEYAK